MAPKPAKLPKIIIEVYFKDEDNYAPLKGSENSQETDCPGIRFECSFDSQFADEYKSRLEVKQNNTDDFKVLDIPIEYYCVKVDCKINPNAVRTKKISF
ncbi:MAG: hypothetical protein ABF437_13490, partial [Lentilactobacillus hilgardii]